MGECLGRCAGADAAGVFPEGHIPDVEEAVFYLPMIAGQAQHGFGVHLAKRDGGDGVDDLAGAVRFQLAPAFNPHDLSDVWPVLVEAGRQFAAHGNGADLDAPVSLAGFLKPGEIRRVDPRQPLPGLAGKP